MDAIQEPPAIVRPAERSAITAVGVVLASRHGKRDPDYNEVNPGLWIEFGGWHVGAYKNTFRRTTAFVMRDFELARGGGWRLSFSAGPATGYEFPAIAFFRLTYGPAALYAMPPIVVGFAARWEIK